MKVGKEKMNQIMEAVDTCCGVGKKLLEYKLRT